MIYNFKRAVGMSVLLYLASFVVGLLAGLATGQDMTSMNQIADWFWYVGMAASVILTALFTMWYFRGGKVTPGAKSGFFFGLTLVVVSGVLDVVFLLVGSSQGAGIDLGAYYGDWRFWVTILLVLATAKWVGYAKRPAGAAM